MIRKRKWLWVLIFVLAVLLLAGLATGWNVLLLQHYRRLVIAASNSAHQGTGPESDLTDPTLPLIALVLGTFGFLGGLGGIILFFVRLLKEMRLTQVQSEFLATVSHELKTPIATLELSASLLQTVSLSDQEKRELWRSHDSELKRLKSEVDTLLEAAKWQNGSIQIKREPLVLQTWLDEVLQRWRGIYGPDVLLEQSGERLNIQIYSDVRMLTLILDNLLDNARKFSSPSGKITVHCQNFPEDESWEIQVCDQGVGFAPGDAEKIFHRFFRAKTSSLYAIPGSGLGLFLAASASKALGLRVRGESPGPDKGARFTLRGKWTSKK